MKRLAGVLMAVALLFSCLGWLGISDAVASPSSPIFAPMPVLVAETGPRNAVDDKRKEIGYRIDLNNTNIRAFQGIPGMYPGIARLVLKYAPFESVDDVLDIAEMTDRQKDVFRANLDKFIVTTPDDALTEGGDRFNNGIYR
jgi:photosystem II PsbU protein